MAKDDYSSTGGGLKLKGAKPTGVEKKRKKKITSATSKAENTSSQKQEDTTTSATLDDREDTGKGTLQKADIEQIDSKTSTIIEYIEHTLPWRRQTTRGIWFLQSASPLKHGPAASVFAVSHIQQKTSQPPAGQL